MSLYDHGSDEIVKLLSCWEIEEKESEALTVSYVPASFA
jgi:hypothetical protein